MVVILDFVPAMTSAACARRCSSAGPAALRFNSWCCCWESLPAVCSRLTCVGYSGISLSLVAQEPSGNDLGRASARARRMASKPGRPHWQRGQSGRGAQSKGPPSTAGKHVRLGGGCASALSNSYSVANPKTRRRSRRYPQEEKVNTRSGSSIEDGFSTRTAPALAREDWRVRFERREFLLRLLVSLLGFWNHSLLRCPHTADTRAPAVLPESNDMRRVLLSMGDIIHFAVDQCHSPKCLVDRRK
jgi:hypothetical protein